MTVATSIGLCSLNTECMDFLEKDLEEIFFEEFQQKGFVDCDELCMSHLKIFRQLRIGKYGVSDLVAFDKPFYCDVENRHVDRIKVTVYELKKDKVNVSTFLQALGYCRGIKSYLKLRGFKRVDFEIVLIGRRIDKESNFVYLTDYLTYGSPLSLNVFTYSYGIEGLKFKEEAGYTLIDEGFKDE